MLIRRTNYWVILPFLFLLTSLQTVRADGLAGEYLLTQRWRDMIAHHSPLTNAALMMEENYISARIAFAPILSGQFKHLELGVVIPIGLYQSVGVTVLGSPEGTVTQGRDTESGQIVPGESSLSNLNAFVMFSYAWHFWDKLSAGINFNLAYSSNFGDSRRGTGIDIGITYRLLRHALLGDHVLGLSTINLIAPTMGKSYMPDFKSTGQYSRDIKLSWIANYWERRLESALDIDIKDFWAAKDEFRLSDGGVSLAKKIEWDINLKLGAWLLRMFKLYLQFGFDEDAIDYWGMAFGINLPSVNSGRDLELLYQYNIMTEAQNDATGHTIYGRMDFGKHREEAFARRMARLASLSPNELYNRARRLYSEKKYWDAFFIFSRILVEFPDFFKNDWVQYYRASCQEELDMREMAVKNYENTRKEFPLSTAVPHADLGLMRVFYRNGDFSNVTNQFIELSKPNVPDSLRFHGAYLMGQTHLQTNDLQKAIQVLSIVPEEHPDYIFAQHAIAIARARLDSDMSEIVMALENCVGAKAETPAQKEVVNRSYLFLGYIFYEENTLSKAVVALRMVPTTSYYAEDALLGQGWTALKARQWTDCISTGQLLSKTSQKGILQCEGMLIQAYGHLLQKQYAQSLALLKTASEKIRTFSTPSEDSLNYSRMQYESNRMSHNFMADKVDNISMVGQTATMGTQADSLRSEQDKYIAKFNEYFTFSREFGRAAFFARSIDAVRDDIDYALATVQKIVGQSGIEKVQQQMEEEQKQIDAEIEKLKREMEKLQNQE